MKRLSWPAAMAIFVLAALALPTTQALAAPRMVEVTSAPKSVTCGPYTLAIEVYDDDSGKVSVSVTARGEAAVLAQTLGRLELTENETKLLWAPIAPASTEAGTLRYAFGLERSLAVKAVFSIVHQQASEDATAGCTLRLGRFLRK